MTKNKPKKHKKLDEEQALQTRPNLLEIDAGKVGNALLVALVGEIVGVIVDRLLQKANDSSAKTQDHAIGHGDRGLLMQVLSGLQANLQTVQQPIQQGLVDAVETAKAVTDDVPGNVDDVKEFVQTKAPQAVQQPANATKVAASIVAGELADTAKKVVRTISSRKNGKSEKRKKKHKK